MDKFESFYKEHCLDGYGYNPDLNWIFEKHNDGSYIQIEVENAKKVYQHQQEKVEELEKEWHDMSQQHEQAVKECFEVNSENRKLQKQFDQHDKLLLQRNKDVQELYDSNVKHEAEKAEMQKRVDAVEQVITKIRNGNYASDQGEGVAKFIAGMLEQALKGEG